MTGSANCGRPLPMSAAHALIEEWRRHLVQDRRRSLHTVRAYMATAERLVAFLQEHQGGAVTRDALAALNAANHRALDRKRVGEGKGVSGRVVLGVGGGLKKKKKKNNI